MSDLSRDPKTHIEDAMREIRTAMGQLRESVVMLVMRRNRLSDESRRQERAINDLKEKLGAAEQAHRDQLANELRNELSAREAEFGRVRQQLIEAEVEAEAAKSRLPEEESRLAQQLNDLQSQYARISSARAELAASDNFSRAEQKILNLQSEANARQEIAGEREIPALPKPTPEESAEKQLQAMEERLGLTAAPEVTPQTPRKEDFLEFDSPSKLGAPNQRPFLSIVSDPDPEEEEAESGGTAELVAVEAPEEPVVSAEIVAEKPVAEADVEDAGEEPLAESNETAPVEEFVAEPVAEEAVAMSEEGVVSEPAETMEETPSETVEEAMEAQPSVEQALEEDPAPVSENVSQFASPLYDAESVVAEAVEEAVAKEESEADAVALEEPEPLEEAVEEIAEATPSASWHIIAQTKGESAVMNPESRVRVAAIGTGNIFRGAHLPVYPELAQAQMVAFCDPDPKAQKLVMERFAALTAARIEKAKDQKDSATVERLQRDLDEVRVYEDISEIIEQVKPDLVDICTQPVLHAPLSIQALNAGLNVMCEKPIARSWLETIRLKEAVKSSGKIYQHNENWLFDKDYYTAKKLIDAGAIGEPVLMFLATAHGGPEGNGRFWNSDMGGGGALLDNGIHAIGAAWYMSGLEKKPAVVKAAEPFGMSIRMPNRIIDGRLQRVNVDDDAHILIRFEDPEKLSWSTAHVEGSWSHRDSPDTAIIGTTGRIVFENADNRTYAVVYDSFENVSRRIETSGPTWQFWPSSFYGEIQNMVECVRLGVPSIMTADFGSDCSAVVGASYLSQRLGKRGVTVDAYKEFALAIAERYPNDPKSADNALIDAHLSAIRS